MKDFFEILIKVSLITIAVITLTFLGAKFINDKIGGKKNMSDITYGYCKDTKCVEEVYTKEAVDRMLQQVRNDAQQSYKVKGDFAVIEGSMTLTANTEEKLNNSTTMQTMQNINFPEGFNKDNCVCVAFGGKTNSKANYSYGYYSGEDSYSQSSGSLKRNILLGNNTDSTKITLVVYNLYTNSVTYYYRIVLMKI